MMPLVYLDAAAEADLGDAIAGEEDELRALLDALERPFAMVRALMELGVDRGLLAQLTGAGDIGLAQVDLLNGGRFAFGGPDRRLVMAVRVHGALTDLVALSSANPDEWALYRGAADFLGEELIDRAVIEERRELRLLATPLAWLRAGGTLGPQVAGGGRAAGAVCVLDWSRSALSALRTLRESTTIVCDPGAGERLKALLAHGGLPRVAEAPAMRRAA